MTSEMTVQLAEHSYTLEPQPYAYLRHQLKKFTAGISMNVDATDIMGLIGGNAYRLLEILIPGLMPVHEFEGYSSALAYETDLERMADDYEGEEEPTGPDNFRASPTNDQILTAIERAAKVNRLDLVKHLRGMVGVLGEDFLRVVGRKALLEATTSLTSESSKSPASTDSDLSTSTTSGPSEEPTGEPGDLYVEGTASEVTEPAAS